MRRDKNKEYIYKIQLETLSTKPTGKNRRGFYSSQALNNIYGWAPHHENAPSP